jgi:hypothetical protein
VKSVLIVGSRKYNYEDIERDKKRLIKSGIPAYTPEKPPGELNDEEERLFLLRSWHILKNVDIVYMRNKYGYIGKTGIEEIVQAYARNKEIITSRKSSNRNMLEYISKTMSISQLIKYAKAV